MKFPLRDPNERMYMGNLGLDSPMFDYVEEICGRKTSGNPDEDRKSKKEKRKIEL